MPGLKPSLKPVRLSKAAPLILAGFVCMGSVGFPGETNDGVASGFKFTFFATALADDGRGHGGGRDNWGGDGARGNGGGGGGWGGSGGSGWGNGNGGGGGGWDGGGGSRWGNGGGSSNSGDGGSSSGGGAGSTSGGGGSSNVGDSGSEKGRRASNSPSSGGGSSSGSNSVSYDADRNMMKLGFKIGRGEHQGGLEPEHRGSEEHHWPEPEFDRRHDHEHRDWGIRDGYSFDHERKEFDECLRDVWERWRENHSSRIQTEPVTTSVPSNAPQIAASDPLTPQNPAAAEPATTTSNERSASAQQNGRGAIDSAKFVIGNSAFMPKEVLAVGLDPASIERAEALGFRADPQAIVSEASGLTITRFTVPAGLDAVSGQGLLNRELPGRRFELNKVYRLYRAAVHEEQPGISDKDKPTTACGADRCFAWQAIGWKQTLAPCARGVKVGVIDTDIDQAHPAFAGRTIHRFDFSPEGHGLPPNGHGTAVLSLLAGNPLGGAPGLIPDAEFFAANIFFSDEHGETAANTLSLLKALDWMKNFNVKLVNMSFSGPRDELVAAAIEKLSKKGLVFVAAAGNDGPMAAPSYPAAYPQVIAVTAVTKDLRNYRYANRGDHIDVAAPGVDIWTAMPGGRAGYQSGTSFAAPHVTAIFAVEPRETLQQDKVGLLDGLPVMDLGRQGRDPVYGRGLLMAPSECMPHWETVAKNE